MGLALQRARAITSVLFVNSGGHAGSVCKLCSHNLAKSFLNLLVAYLFTERPE